MRALKEALTPGGILIMTTHGERCMWALLPQERRVLDEQGVRCAAGWRKANAVILRTIIRGMFVTICSAGLQFASI